MRKRIAWLVFVMFFVMLTVIPVFAHDMPAELPSGYIVQLKEPLHTLTLLGDSDSASVLHEIHPSLHIYSVNDPSYVEMLQESGLLVYAEPDYEVTLFTDENTNTSETSSLDLWHLEMIGTAYADDLGYLGQDIRIAVIDSGVYQHTDFGDNLLSGYNFITDTSDVTDNIGHGTFVAGLIAAEDNQIGVTGAAPASKILPLKCFDTGVDTTISMICRAIYAAVDEYDCQILNMSFGVKQYSETLDTAIQYAFDQGVITVASAGNYGTSTSYYPAAFANVIGVGAVDRDGEVASFSQRNDTLTVVAPGKAVYSTNNKGEYSVDKGTSFAAPLVSGILARLLNVQQDLTPQTVSQALTAGAIDLGDEGYDLSYGFGLASLPRSISFLSHDTPSVIHTPAADDGDCTTAIKCAYCLTDVVPAKQHSFTEEVVGTRRPATCMEEGSVTMQCTDCSQTQNQTLAFDKTNHSGKNHIENAVAATCETTGYSGDTVCECGVTLTFGEITPMLNHDWDDGVITKAATCTEDGSTTFTCLHNCMHTKTETVPATGHKYDSGAVTTAPSCETAGVKTFTCLNDSSHTYTEDIASIGHSYTEVVTAPTCTTEGYTTFTCGTCQNSYETDRKPALGHTYCPLFSWETNFSAVSAVGSCSDCKDEQELNCTIVCTWDQVNSKLVFTATAVMDGNFVTDSQYIHLLHSVGKLTVINTAAQAAEKVDMIIMVAGYTGGQLTDCLLIGDVHGVTEISLTISGDLKVFFLRPNTYTPFFPCIVL